MIRRFRVGLTSRPFGYGFAEGVDVLLRLRENR